MMYATWFTLPTSVARVWWVIFAFDCIIDLIAFDHAFAFSIGSAIVNRLVSIDHPRKVSISVNPPSACNLRSDAASGRVIGSSVPLCGRNCKCNAISTADFARSTCARLSFVANTAVAKSSMYPSVPAVWFGGSETSASSADPNGMSAAKSWVLGTARCIGEFSSEGFQSEQCVRSFAKSHVMSDPTEKWAGAGDEPNGSHVSMIPISSFSFVFHNAMHLAAILGVVWNLR